MEITCVTIDCRDPPKVATFWNEALGWGGVAVAPDGTGAVSGPTGGGVFLEFIVVPEDKVPQRRPPRPRGQRALPQRRLLRLKPLVIGANRRRSVVDPWWVRGRSVVGTDVPGSHREDHDLTIRTNGSPGRSQENPMHQITTAMVQHHQSELRTDAKRWRLSRVARAARTR